MSLVIEEFFEGTSDEVRERLTDIKKKPQIFVCGYLTEAIHKIFVKVLPLTPHILDGVERTMIYCNNITERLHRAEV
jgi:hypothetical protein